MYNMKAREVILMENSKKTMDKIVALCKGRGFVYPGSEIYGGLANTWDYGPLGMALKNNIKQAWLKKFVQAWTARSARQDTAPTTSLRTLTAQTLRAGQTSR